MKKFSDILKTTLFIVAITCFGTAKAQELSKDKNAQTQSIQSLVESKNFVLDVESVTPTGGKTRQLTPYYTLKVFNDSVIANLPYYGKAYSATINPDEGGINFTSAKSDYKMSNRKKGRWDITITPHDANDVRELSLTIFDNGNATLFVISNNRQNISYYGVIKSRSEMK